MTARLAVLHLGRAAGMGEERRVASWVAIAEAAGVKVVEVPLLSRGRPRPRDLARRSVRTFQGRAVPESLAWSGPRVLDAVTRAGATAVICITSRTYDSRLHEAAPVVILDFVDQLSSNYADRAALRSGMARAAWRTLAWSHGRFETRVAGASSAVLTAAGRHDAEELGAQWVPNVVDVHEPVDAGLAQFDVLFFGNLAYGPNIAAVHRLARLWPRVIAQRPGTTLLLAGARPSREIEQLSANHGWSLRADFKDLSEVCAAARICVVPLEHAGGIQNKVLEAASFGMAQVLTPAVMAGLDPGFPAAVAADDAGLVAEVVALLDDGAARADLAAASRAHVGAGFGAATWADWLASTIGGGSSDSVRRVDD